MKIERVDSKRDMGLKVERIELIVDGVKYTITERFGKINIHSHDDSITVSPCCANELEFK